MNKQKKLLDNPSLSYPSTPSLLPSIPPEKWSTKLLVSFDLARWFTKSHLSLQMSPLRRSVERRLRSLRFAHPPHISTSSFSVAPQNEMPGLMYLRKKVMTVQIGRIGALMFDMKVRGFETSCWSTHRWLSPHVCVILNKIYPVLTPP